MNARTAQLVTEVQSDGKIVPRFVCDRFYDPNSIEGRTGEGAARKLGNQFDAAMIAANRVRELNNGSSPLIKRQYGNRVTAVQEIEQGLIGYELFGKVYKTSSRQNRQDK
jgi:DNA-directed RNA polymerase subunit K/omega